MLKDTFSKYTNREMLVSYASVLLNKLFEIMKRFVCCRQGMIIGMEVALQLNSIDNCYVENSHFYFIQSAFYGDTFPNMHDDTRFLMVIFAGKLETMYDTKDKAISFMMSLCKQHSLFSKLNKSLYNQFIKAYCVLIKKLKDRCLLTQLFIECEPIGLNGDLTLWMRSTLYLLHHVIAYTRNCMITSRDIKKIYIENLSNSCYITAMFFGTKDLEARLVQDGSKRFTSRNLLLIVMEYCIFYVKYYNIPNPNEEYSGLNEELKLTLNDFLETIEMILVDYQDEHDANSDKLFSVIMEDDLYDAVYGYVQHWNIQLSVFHDGFSDISSDL